MNSQEWEDSTVTVGSAAGGDLLTILGFGFTTQPDSYYCEIGEPQASSVLTTSNGHTVVNTTVYAAPAYAAASFSAHTIKARLITCLTQPYLYSAVGRKVLRVMRRVTSTETGSQTDSRTGSQSVQTVPITMYNSALQGGVGTTGLNFSVLGSIAEAVPPT
jgi:hypothetical protein